MKINAKKLFADVQNIIPQNKLSTLAGKVAQSSNPYIKTPLMYAFSKAYGVTLHDYERKHLHEYDSFNDFFSRELTKDARPVDDDPAGIACPADGVISQIGTILDGQLLQAKGHSYSAAQLLADFDDGIGVNGGSFATVYLAPSNYHRVHMPFDGVLVETRYVPGDLFSVNQITANYVPDLFARNERLVCVFDTAFGRAFVVLVGAMIVAGIECVATGKIERSEHLKITTHHLSLKKGDELGRFYLGSTAIVVLPKSAQTSWREEMGQGRAVKMGERLGRWQRDE